MKRVALFIMSLALLVTSLCWLILSRIEAGEQRSRNLNILEKARKAKREKANIFKDEDKETEKEIDVLEAEVLSALNLEKEKNNGN